MRFNDVYVSQAERFTIGVEQDAGRYYISFPVSNSYADYEEYYEIDRVQFDTFLADLQAALVFVTACRRHENDALLIVKPGRLRGSAS